jgi:hypothetical protein
MISGGNNIGRWISVGGVERYEASENQTWLAGKSTKFIEFDD